MSETLQALIGRLTGQCHDISIMKGSFEGLRCPYRDMVREWVGFGCQFPESI